MSKLDKESVIGISALLVHAANIDEIYSEHEKTLIKDFIKSYLKEEDADEILVKAENIEKNSNQLLNYTLVFSHLEEQYVVKTLETNTLNLSGNLIYTLHHHI